MGRYNSGLLIKCADMADPEKPANFIQQIISSDIQSGKTQKLITRFPEPNGFCILVILNYLPKFCLVATMAIVICVLMTQTPRKKVTSLCKLLSMMFSGWVFNGLVRFAMHLITLVVLWLFMRAY